MSYDEEEDDGGPLLWQLEYEMWESLSDREREDRIRWAMEYDS